MADELTPGSEEADEVRREFADRVNMTRSELQDWLAADESKEVGQKDGGGESTGHESGRRIVGILGKKKDDLTASDLGHMRKVNGYIARHLKQRPDQGRDELGSSAWARSLRNWGHDPLKS
jgi:hypothetical protein